MTCLLVMTTMPDMASAEELAGRIAGESLAACVNILPGVQSIYCWEGKLQKSIECQLFIKTCEKSYNELEAFIQKHHPYKLPEIIALPIQHGLQGYLDWIGESCEDIV